MAKINKTMTAHADRNVREGEQLFIAVGVQTVTATMEISAAGGSSGS